MTTPVPSAYPIERPEPGSTDPRFTFGLALDIRDVLIAHGYPDTFSGIDLYNLQASLFAFIYGADR